ncbi:putative membrane protein [Helicobacter pylori Hp A-17]|nr:putative membrane protein [Helicobacter pylori Hp A-17]
MISLGFDFLTGCVFIAKISGFVIFLFLILRYICFILH